MTRKSKKQEPIVDSEFSEFLKKIESCGCTVHNELPEGYNNWGKQPNPIKGYYLLSDQWTTGGMSGGNCWGDEATPIYYADEEKELSDLDRLLQAIAPNITYLNYREIAKLIDEHRWSQSEYYGNHYDYAIKYVNLKDLYAIFKKLGI